MLRSTSGTGSAISGPLESWLIKGLLPGFIILAAVSALSAGSVARLQHAKDGVSHALEVSSGLHSLQSLITDVETGTRGYLISGEESYLEPVRVARQKLNPQLRQLAELVGDNPEQSQQLEALRSLLARRVEIASELEAARRQGSAGPLFIGGEEKRVHDQVRAQIARMLDAEHRLLSARQARSARETRLTWWLLVPTGALSLCLGLAAAVSLRKAQQRLLALNASLDQRVDERTAELAASEAKFRAVVEQALVGIFIEQDGRFAYANQAMADMRGCASPEDLVGQSFAEWMAPEDWAWIETLTQGGQAEASFTFQGLRNDGQALDLEVRQRAIQFKGRAAVIGIIENVTERKGAERAILESEHRFRELFQHLPVAYQSLDIQGRWNDANANMAALLGFDAPEQMLGLDFIDYWDESIRDQFDSAYDEFKATHNVEGELKLVRRDGEARMVQVAGRIQRDADGRFVKTHCIVIDITERKHMEDALRTSEQELHLLAEAMPQIVWATDAQGLNTYFNQQWAAYTGLSLEESYGHGWTIPFHPDDRQRAWDAWRNAVERNGTYSLECRLRRADGVYRWWLIRGVPVRDKQGGILKWFGTCTDIHDLKLREHAIKASEARRSFALDTLHAGEWELDLATRQAVRSLLHDQIFGYASLVPEWTYETLLDHVLPEDRERVDRLFKQALAEGSIWDFECRIRRVDGEVRWIHARGQSRLGEAGEPLLTGIVMDITARVLATREMDRIRLLMQEGERIAQLGTWEYIAADQSTVWSEEEFRIYGVDPATPSPDYQSMLRERIPADDAERLNRIFKAALEQGAPYEMEHKVVWPDGTVRHVQDLAYPTFDPDGKLTKYIGTTLDITDRKRAEAEIR